MHAAHLFGYPGIGSQDSSAFIDALRDWVDSSGVDRPQGTGAIGVTVTDDGFRVDTEAAPVVGLSRVTTGANGGLAKTLGCEFDSDAVDIGLSKGTSVESAYATGAMTGARSGRP